MSSLKISRAEAFLATLLVSGGVVVFVVASNYRGVVEAKVTKDGFEFRVDGRELPKALPEAKPPSKASPDPAQKWLKDEADSYLC
jgi:hypothetical protein